MNPAYARWIVGFATRHSHFVRGMCDSATKEMVAAFPELRRAAGFVYYVHGREQHWWCVATDGKIVDPTVAQFGGSPIVYEELDLNDPETRKKVPTGRCMECGEDVYGTTFCNDDCERAFSVATFGSYR